MYIYKRGPSSSVVIATDCGLVLVPDDGRNRPKHVVFYHPVINIIRYTCCVIDLITLPINLYTQRGWHISEGELYRQQEPDSS